MSSEIHQLDIINVNDFNVITMGEHMFLMLSPDDPEITACGSVAFDEKRASVSMALKKWIEAWNIDELVDLKLSTGASYTSRKLSIPEKERFENLRNKMRRCKLLSLNYYENTLFSNEESK